MTQPPATLAAAAELVRARTVSSVELVRAALAEIETQDGRLNSFITVAGEQALRSAEAMDEELARGAARGPLHGIPVSLKDNIDTTSIETTAGSPLFRGRIPDSDADVWGRLDAAGAVLVGKNNLWELAFGGPHPDHGPTWNPWDVTRTAGGTSGGSAAAVAGGLVHASLGTDTGGSARVPAALCGVVSLKPTYGRVSTRGVLPVSHSMDHVCPIARTVDDVALVFAAIVDGTPGASPATDLATTRLGIVHTAATLAPHVQAAFDQATALLAASGAELVEVEPPDLEAAVAAGRIVLDVDAADFHRRAVRDHPNLLGESTLARLQTAAFVPARDYVRAQRVRRRTADELEALLRTVDALVLPALNDTAYVVDENGREPSAGRVSGPFMLPFDATGHPAIVVPSGLAPDGLPTSVQLVGRLGDDEQLLAIAAAYEQARGALPSPPRAS